MTKKAKNDFTTNTQHYQSLLAQANQIKNEMNILYDLYKTKRAAYDSIRSQIEEVIYKLNKENN